MFVVKKGEKMGKEQLNIQIGVCSSTMKSHGTSFVIRFINKHPITLDMTVKSSFPFSVKRMVTILWRQWLFVYNHFYDLAKFEHLHTTFLHQLKLFSEKCCVNRVKHWLITYRRFIRVIPHKILPHFVKRAKPLCRNLTPHHSASFLNSGHGLGIIARVPGYRIAIFGA